MLDKTRTSIAAATVSLGAVVTPAAMAQDYPPANYHGTRQQVAQPKANQWTSPDACCGLVIAGGIGAAAAAQALRRKPGDTEDTLHGDRADADEYEYWRGKNRDWRQNKRGRGE